MKTIIFYATKYGSTKTIAEKIAKHFPDAALIDLKRDPVPDLAPYGRVILGCSVYAGTLRAEAKRFAANNANLLAGKKLGLFLCGFNLNEDSHPRYFSGFPKELLDAAQAKAFLGGIYDPVKTGRFDRFIFKAAAKQATYINIIQEDKIQAFADALK